MKSILCHDLLIVKYVFTSTILNLLLHVIFLHVMVYLGSFVMLVTGSLLETNMKTLFTQMAAQCPASVHYTVQRTICQTSVNNDTGKPSARTSSYCILTKFFRRR